MTRKLDNLAIFHCCAHYLFFNYNPVCHVIELIVNPVGGMRGEEILTPSELRIMKWYRSVFGVFLVRVFRYFDWKRRDTTYLSVFSLNAEKYGPEILEYGNFSHSISLRMFQNSKNNWVGFVCFFMTSSKVPKLTKHEYIVKRFSNFYWKNLNKEAFEIFSSF